MTSQELNDEFADDVQALTQAGLLNSSSSSSSPPPPPPPAALKKKTSLCKVYYAVKGDKVYEEFDEIRSETKTSFQKLHSSGNVRKFPKTAEGKVRAAPSRPAPHQHLARRAQSVYCACAAQAAAEKFVKMKPNKLEMKKKVGYVSHWLRSTARAFRWIILVVIAFAFGFTSFYLNGKFQEAYGCHKLLFNPFCQASRKLGGVIDSNMNYIVSGTINALIAAVVMTFSNIINNIFDI